MIEYGSGKYHREEDGLSGRRPWLIC